MGENFDDAELETLTDEELAEFCAEYYGGQNAYADVEYGHCSYDVNVFLSAAK